MATDTLTAAAPSPSHAGRLDPPALAPNVRLVGEFEGSGFEEPQWLIEREGQFVQVTDLLYRLAEQLDGRRTIDEIAAQLTAATDWEVTPDDVRYLLETRLAPLRLVRGHPEPAAEPLRRPDPSALSVNLRTKTIGPRLIDPATRVLQHLFAPPVVVLVLTLATLGEVWLYRSGVLLGAFVDALYTPGFLLIAIALVLLGAAFHELGHASALRYGGGRARAIGAGIYLVFPVFYTDVTDSYRLSRWARVRTGLGGIYFHLVFVLGLIGVALAFDQRFLLVAVLLVNLEIVRQLVPFVRLDGYWVLTDLTGIPDFFSLMEPFVRSLLPAAPPGLKLPRLKPWAKAVFASYIGLLVPAICVLLFLLVEHAPRVARVLWDAVVVQVGLLSTGWGDADVLAVATALAQLAILSVSAVGSAYVLFGSAWKLVRASWRLRAPARRAVALAAVSVPAGLVALHWGAGPP